MKNHLIAPALLAFISADLYAHTSYCTPYLGLGVGAMSTRTDVSIRRDIGAVNPLRDSVDVQKQSVAGEVLGGWGWYYNRMYYGAEAYFNLTENKGAIRFNTSPADPAGEDLEVKTRYAGGVAARLGYLLNKNSMVYARLGYEARRFNVTLDRDLVLNDIRKKYTRGAIVPGVGFEIDVMPHWTVGGEGRIAYFINSKTFRTGTSEIKIKPRVDTLMLNLKYKFFVPKC